MIDILKSILSILVKRFNCLTQKWFWAKLVTKRENRKEKKMSNTINKVTLVGFLGADPELKYTPGGTAVCNLRLATDESYLNKDKVKVERAEWHRVTVWGKQAEACAKYLTKGRQVLVMGKLQTRSYEKEGQKHYVTEIIADQVNFLGTSKEKNQEQQQSASAADSSENPMDVELPI